MLRIITGMHPARFTELINEKAQGMQLQATGISLRGMLGFSFVPAIVAYFSFLARNYQLDDALIYLRYVRNFQDGLGLVYNPGEKFNGLTSPLFTYVSLAASFIFSNLQIATIVVSALFFACAAVLGGFVFAESKWEAFFTGLAIASFGYFYSTFGMETPLFLMLTGLSLYLYRIDSKYFPVALALMVITRYEGVFLAVPMVTGYVMRNRRLPDAKMLAVAAAVFLAPFAINYFYYGDLLPATASAKFGQGKSGLWVGQLSFLNLGYLVKTYFSGSRISALFFVAAAAYGAFVGRKDRTTIVMLIYLFCLLCFYAGLRLPNYPWYYAPFFFLLLIFACRGIWSLGARFVPTGKLDHRAAIYGCLCALAIFAVTQVVTFREGERREEYARIGGWLQKNTPPNASVAMIEIGTVGWYAHRKIVDILGLVNPYNADYIARGDLYGWLYRYQPDYILRHDPIWAWEKSSVILEKSGAYVPAQGFDHPRFVLLKKTDKYTDAEIAKYFRELSEQREKSRSTE